MKAIQRHCIKETGIEGKYRILFPIVWGLVFFSFIIPHVLCTDVWADDSGKRIANPRIDLDDPIYKNYPKKLDGRGYIDVIEPGRLLIDDTPYPLAAFVTFHAPKRRSASIKAFREGQYVGFLLDSNGAIKSVFLLKLK